MSRECWTLLGSMPRCRRSSTVLSPTACDVCVAPLQSAGWPCERCPRARTDTAPQVKPPAVLSPTVPMESVVICIYVDSVRFWCQPAFMESVYFGSQSVSGVSLFWESVCFRSQSISGVSIFGVGLFQESVCFWVCFRNQSISGVSLFLELVCFRSQSILGVSLFLESVHFWSQSVLGLGPFLESVCFGSQSVWSYPVVLHWLWELSE